MLLAGIIYEVQTASIINFLIECKIISILKILIKK